MSRLSEYLKNWPAEKIFKCSSTEVNVEPICINQALRKLEKIGDSRITNVSDVDIDLLVRKVKHLAKYGKGNLTLREINHLPFVMHHKYVDEQLLNFILGLMNKSSRNTLMREMYAYIMNYSDSVKNEMIRMDISNRMKKIKGKNIRLNRWVSSGYLFAEKAHITLAEFIKEFNFSSLMDDLMFKDTMVTSGLVQEALKYLFSAKYRDTRKKLDKFYEIYDAGIIKPIFNVVASNLIFSVEKGHNLNTDKEKLRTIFYKEIGDPRLDTVRWNSIDPEAKRIFINWISRYDLELFFKIINEVSGSDYSVKRMWRERETFWKSFLPYITNTWVFLGWQAADVAKAIDGEHLLRYGDFGGGGLKSAILFTLGNITFVERSYNGGLRGWKKNECKIYVGQKAIKESDIFFGTDHICAIIHNGKWQERVWEVINNYSGINFNENGR